MENQVKEKYNRLQENINTAKEDGNITQRYVSNVVARGTEEQINELNERLSVYGLTIEDYDQKRPVTEQEVEYFKSIYQPDMTKPTERDHIGRITTMIHKKMGLTPHSKPKELTYSEVRKLVWGAFVNIVSIGTKCHPDEVKASPHQIEYLRNLTHYIIGSDEGEWNPNRSLYFYGDLGSGKSTLAKVAHFVSNYIDETWGWKARTFGFCSMEELFISTYSSQQMSQIADLASGFYVIDELKEKHKDYKHYGNDFNLLDDVLTVRYNLWNDRKIQTILTANLDPNSFLELFQDQKFETYEGEKRSRLIGRIKQQYICIHIDGPNHRQSVNNT